MLRWRDLSEGERERTVVALRSAYEETSGSVSEAFSGMLERFQASAGEMRGVSQEIRREIDATRQELRKGAADLPRETAEQAAAMRRVVTEQVEALAELTALMKRSGRALDVAEPVEAVRIETKPAAPSSSRLLESPTPPAAQPRSPDLHKPDLHKPDLHRPDLLKPDLHKPDLHKPDLHKPVRSKPPASETQAQREPARTAASPSKSPTQSPIQRGSGWLTDLLARASRDEESPQAEAPRPVAPEAAAPPSRPAPSQQRAAESLDNLSTDIARMINHDAVVDQWDRYYKGDRQPFSRKLYTPQGQQTFEEIRRRYPLDRDFREAVDRYTAEFERVVNEASREDRDGSLVRNYLTSETGKVYTMLAHAAGRFD